MHAHGHCFVHTLRQSATLIEAIPSLAKIRVLGIIDCDFEWHSSIPQLIKAHCKELQGLAMTTR
jgi:hypothetical protein